MVDASFNCFSHFGALRNASEKDISIDCQTDAVQNKQFNYN